MSIVVHSSMISFGYVEGGAGTALEAILERVGDSGTIIVPTFTFHLGPEDVFDPLQSECRTGELSELVRTTSEAFRGSQPIHSYAAIGSDAGIVLRGDPDLSFGDGSIFQQFYEGDVFWLTLGCRFDKGATYIHQCEANIGVPYREWINLRRTRRISDEQVESVNVEYFAMQNGFRDKWNPIEIERRISSHVACTSAKTNYGISRFMPIRTLDQVVSEAIISEPYALIDESGRED